MTPTKASVQAWTLMRVAVGAVWLGALELAMMARVQAAQRERVDQDQHDEGEDAALLGEPEAEREAAEPVLVEDVGEQHAAAQADRRPEDQQQRHDPEVGAPVAVDRRHDPRVVDVDGASVLGTAQGLAEDGPIVFSGGGSSFRYSSSSTASVWGI